MRKSTLASVLILCGSTAALANVAGPAPQDMSNNTANSTLSNDVYAPDPAPPAPDAEPTPAPQPTPAPDDPVTNTTTEPPTD